MSSTGRDRGGDSEVELTHLRFVGPATADVLKRVPIDATDLLDRTVSYAKLLESGVNPGVAGKLRREYSLVWSFDWVAGAHLAHRADQVGGLDPDQREWIADSPASDSGQRGPVSDAERAWRERSTWLDSAGDGAARCERCDGPLVDFQLGESQTFQCEDCGYVGVPVRFH